MPIAKVMRKAMGREPLRHRNGSFHQDQMADAMRRGMMRLLRALPLLLVAACKPPPDDMQHMPQADPARGKAVVERVGCGACHDIPGIRWPKGKSGPSLRGFAEQGLIAGRLPNRPDNLAAFVRDAPAVVEGTTMPAMPISETEARDVAAFLYSRMK